MNHLPEELKRIIIEYSHVPPFRKILNTSIAAGRNEWGWDFNAAFYAAHTIRIVHAMLHQGYFPFHLPDRTITLHNKVLMEIPYVASLLRSIGIYRRAGKEVPIHLTRMQRCHRKLSRWWHHP